MNLKISLKAIVILIFGLVAVGIYVVSSEQSLSGELVREVEGDEESIIIGVISDTHIPTRAEGIPLRVYDIFNNASYILHAGDFVQLSVAVDLEKIAPLVAVYGNMDTVSVKKKYPRVNSLEVLGWKIGIMHDGIPILRSARLERFAKRNGFDVLIFGHTHRGIVREEDGVLYVNPGSPTQPFFSKASVAVLRVSIKEIKAEIVYLE
jgi:hypothetical protein